MSHKVCTVCKETKPLEEYYNLKAAKDGKSWRCKECDKNTTLHSRKVRYERSRLQQRHANRKAKYGLTEGEFNKLLTLQGGKCECCGELLTDEFEKQHARNKLVIDHCHKTGEVRGLLCTMCNKGIGLLGETADSLYKAYKYLKKFETDH